MDIDNLLRIYMNNYVTIVKANGEAIFGKLISVDFDMDKIEYYALLFMHEKAIRVYEKEIEEVIPKYEDRKDPIIDSVRTILADKYLLWDGGVLTDRKGTFPVVNITKWGDAIIVEYCKDLFAEDVVFYDVFERPSVDLIVSSVEQNFEKYAPKKKSFKFWRKNK